MTKKDNSTLQGFTLIELSVVLVIIGLLVGGILVGRDLVKAAELRATIGQVDKYNSAVQTFKLKYNALPGDVRVAEAAAFGIFTLTGGTAGLGDGNGLIEGGSAGSTLPAGETLAFWRHLFEAGFVDGVFGTLGNSVIVAATGYVTGAVTNIPQSLPPTKITPENYFTVFSANGLNYFEIVSVSGIATTPAYSFSTNAVTPINAFNMDSKLDDGKPNAGSIIARGIAAMNAAASVAATTTAATCTIGTGIATDTYNGVIASGGNDTSCGIRFRFQ